MNAAIAQHLNILESAIVRVEEWAKVLFVVVRGVGGRFVSKKVAKMTKILYRIETADEIFDGEHECAVDASVLEGSSPHHGTTQGAIAWGQIRKDVLKGLSIQGRITKESFWLPRPEVQKPQIDPEKQQLFESAFTINGVLKIGNAKASGKWMVYERLTNKSYNNCAAKAKEMGFKSAWYRDGKAGVLLEELYA